MIRETLLQVIDEVGLRSVVVEVLDALETEFVQHNLLPGGFSLLRGVRRLRVVVFDAEV